QEIRSVNDDRPRQSDSFSGMGERSGEISEGTSRVEIGIVRLEAGSIASDRDVLAGGNKSIRGEGKFDSVAERPAGETDGVGATVVKLDELFAVIAGNRMVHQFIDDNVADADGSVRGGAGFLRKAIEVAGTIRASAKGNAWFKRTESNGVE